MFKTKGPTADFSAESFIVKRDGVAVVEMRDLMISGPVDAVLDCVKLFLAKGDGPSMKPGGVIPGGRPNPSGSS